MIKKPLALIILIIGALTMFQMPVFAQSNIDAEVQTINESIKDKQESLGDVNKRIDELEKEVNKLQKKARSLETEVAIIENRSAKVELDIEATNLQISTTLDELSLLDTEINDLEDEQDRQRAILKTALQEIQESDQRSGLFLVFGTESFSDFFERVRFFERVNRRLSEAVENTKELSQALQHQRDNKEDKLSDVQELAQELSDQQEQLDTQQYAKQVLVRQTKESEAEYQDLVDELLAEQSYIQNQIVALQDDIDRRLRDEDLTDSGGSTLSWPLDPSVNRVTATYHDPTYPFRYLFEHSGLDVAAPVGSAIRSPAPGYVAWTRQGRLYGNYMMVIHADGIATLYAHLSSFNVVADQFVARGEVIARSGGCRGCSGAGLSTGAHLHFEVRRNGIPVDPLQYVIRP